MAIISTFATPPYLYRYRSIEGAKLDRELSAVEDGHIFCPSITAMNDPMEGSHRLSVLFSSDKRKRKVYQEVLRTRKALGIASFSEVFDHEPMWAHYADQFRGICIAYSFRRLMEHIEGEEHVFVRMNYSETTPLLRWSAGTVDDDARLTISSKTVRWASEREWRLISPTQGPTSYAENCVVRVYVGSRVERSERHEIYRRMHAMSIPVSTMSVRNYAINFTTYKPSTSQSRTKREAGI